MDFPNNDSYVHVCCFQTETRRLLPVHKMPSLLVLLFSKTSALAEVIDAVVQTKNASDENNTRYCVDVWYTPDLGVRPVSRTGGATVGQPEHTRCDECLMSDTAGMFR